MSLYLKYIIWNYRPFSGAPHAVPLQTDFIAVLSKLWPVTTTLTIPMIRKRSRSQRGSSPLRWVSMKPNPERRMTSFGCPTQDHLDLHSATTSNTNLDPEQMQRVWLFITCSSLFTYRVRIGSWVSRLQVFARAEDADGKLIPIKSTANGEVIRMGRKV